MFLEILLIFVVVLLLVILSIAGWIIGTYNLLVSLRQSINTQFSNIKTEYQRRADLFYNLVQAVKSHTKFEKSTLVEVTKMRNINFGQSVPENIQAMKGIDNMFSRLLVTLEKYPELKSYKHYTRFMKEVKTTEDLINVARTDFNDIVREYNTTIKSFPSNVIANWFRFNLEEYYTNEEKTKYAPKVSFDEDKRISLIPHE